MSNDHHTRDGDRLLKRCEMDAWIAGRVLRESRQRVAIGLRALLSRDSATHHGNAAVVAEGDTCMARIRGARGDEFRTGLLCLFKDVDPFREPEASGTPAAF
jgi:hypothetical protein